ncbi:MAG: acetate/propionate family kinase [Chitinivorax sp.]
MQTIVVINAGSSSIKFSLFDVRGDTLELELHGQIEGIYTAPHFVARTAAGAVIAEQRWPAGSELGHHGALEQVRAFLRQQQDGRQLIGVGHRVVHGGPQHARPERITPQLLDELQAFVPLAPLHQPHNLAPIRILLDEMPELPQVACFDTAFHRSNPDVAQRFALPARLHDAGVRRYGFHGLSYEYIAEALRDCDPAAAAGKVVVLHLGNGASMCAIDGGRSIASTMGFTAVEGLPMGTRCGALDPGVLLYLMQHDGMDAAALEKLLYQQSGLLGVSGVSSDMRSLLASDAPGAKLAVDLYLYRIRRELGSLAAALGGLDAIVFTAGIGEHAAPIRERVCRDAAWLGVELDPVANAAGHALISTPDSRVRAWELPTNEELMIARHTRDLLNGTTN